MIVEVIKLHMGANVACSEFTPSQRELFIAPEHPELADDLADYFNVSCDDGLKLEPLYVNGEVRQHV